MNFKLNEITNPRQAPTTDNFIGIYNDGLQFSSNACRRLNLNPGDKVSFVVENSKMYLVLDPTNGYTLIRSTSKRLSFYRRSLIYAVREFTGMQNLALKIGEFKEGRWPLTPVEPKIRKNNKI